MWNYLTPILILHESESVISKEIQQKDSIIEENPFTEPWFEISYWAGQNGRNTQV